MIKCLECIERLKPDDPRVRSGKYNRCGCDYCDKPTYFIELEGARDPQPTTPINGDVERLYKKVEQIQSMQIRFQGKFDEYIDASKKKRTNRYNTYK